MGTPKEDQQAERLKQNKKNQKNQDEDARLSVKREGRERQAPHNFEDAEEVKPTAKAPAPRAVAATAKPVAETQEVTRDKTNG